MLRQKARNNFVFLYPKEVVEQMVCSTHNLLQQDFQLELGLADEGPGVMYIRKESFINFQRVLMKILPLFHVDPATGTGIFVLAIIILIRETMRNHWLSEGRSSHELAKLWSIYVGKENGLFDRLIALEIMKVSALITEIRLGLLLQEDEEMSIPLSSIPEYKGWRYCC